MQKPQREAEEFGPDYEAEKIVNKNNEYKIALWKFEANKKMASSLNIKKIPVLYSAIFYIINGKIY